MNRLCNVAAAGLLVFTLGCGASPQQDAAVIEAKPAVFNADGAPTLALKVPGIHCEACGKGVTACLTETPGVVDVAIDVDTKTATVAFNDTEFDTEVALAALEEANYGEATLVDSEAEDAASGDASDAEPAGEETTAEEPAAE